MTYFCLNLFQCTFLPEVGIDLEIIFSLAARKSQSFQMRSWVGGLGHTRHELVGSACCSQFCDSWQHLGVPRRLYKPSQFPWGCRVAEANASKCRKDSPDRRHSGTRGHNSGYRIQGSDPALMWITVRTNTYFTGIFIHYLNFPSQRPREGSMLAHHYRSFMRANTVSIREISTGSRLHN